MWHIEEQASKARSPVAFLCNACIWYSVASLVK
jgi:hypothetical protein